MSRFIIGFICSFFVASMSAQAAEVQVFYVDGLKVIYKQVPKEIVSINFVIRGGTANYTKEEQGIELLALKWAASGGTVHYPKSTLVEKLERYGSELEVTSRYDYALVSMMCLKQSWTESWKIFGEVLTDPALEERQFSLIKNQLKSDARYFSQDPQMKLRNLAMSNSFRGTNYEKIPEGTVNSISRLKAERVRGYFKNMVGKNNCFLVVVGNLDADELRNKIAESIGRLPEKQHASYPEPGSSSVAATHSIHKHKVETNYLRGYFNAPAMNGADGLPMVLAVDMLNERIVDVVRRTAGLSYDPGVSYPYSIISQPYAYFRVSTTKPAEAVKLMQEVLREVRENGFSKDELDRQKATYVTYYFLDQQATSYQAELLLLNELRGDLHFGEQMADHIQAINLQNVNEVIHQYADTVSWTYLGDTSAIKQSDLQK